MRCGRIQSDPRKGAAPWARGVARGHQVLVCPPPQRGQRLSSQVGTARVVGSACQVDDRLLDAGHPPVSQRGSSTDKVEPVKRQVAAVRTEATQRIQGEKKRVEAVEAELNAQLKRFTRGLVPGINLPEIKL
jgi:hypothetical protein